MKNDLATDTPRTRTHTWLKTICAIFICILQCPVADGAQSGCECDTVAADFIETSGISEAWTSVNERTIITSVNERTIIIQPFLLRKEFLTTGAITIKNTHTPPHTRGRGLPLHHYFERALSVRWKFGSALFGPGKWDLLHYDFEAGIKNFENGIFLFDTSP